MKNAITLLILLLTNIVSRGQNNQPWTEADKKKLLDNLVKSRDEIIQETKNLSESQWNFQENPNRWSIRQIIEHINIWELIEQYQISTAIQDGPNPEKALKAYPDSVYEEFIFEEKPHVSIDFTKPFTFSIPMGKFSGEDNLAWFLKMRNEEIAVEEKSNLNLREYCYGNNTALGIYIYVYGHTYRHLRQIRKIKQHPDYPKK